MDSGHKLQGNWCQVCNSEVQYSVRYDAHYCELCNAWLEEKCTEPDCEYCAARPDKPSQNNEPGYY